MSLLDRKTFSPTFIVERAHRWLAPRPPRPIVARLLNYRDRGAALRHARELRVLPYEGSELALYLDFTPQVQEACGQFAPAKRNLRELQPDYAMLYPARLRLTLNGKNKIYSDPQALQQELKKLDKERKRTP